MSIFLNYPEPERYPNKKIKDQSKEWQKWYNLIKTYCKEPKQSPIKVFKYLNKFYYFNDKLKAC